MRNTKDESDDVLHPVGVVGRVLGVSTVTIRQRIDNGQIAARRTSTGERLVTDAELRRVVALRRGPLDE